VTSRRNGDARADGSRVNAIILRSHWMAVSFIRPFRSDPITGAHSWRINSDRAHARAALLYGQGRLNLLISGGTAQARRLLNVLSGYIPTTDRL